MTPTRTVRLDVAAIVADAKRDDPLRLAWEALAMLDIPESWGLTGDTGILLVEDEIVEACTERGTGTALLQVVNADRGPDEGQIIVAFKGSTVTVYDHATFIRPSGGV